MTTSGEALGEHNANAPYPLQSARAGGARPTVFERPAGTNAGGARPRAGTSNGGASSSAAADYHAAVAPSATAAASVGTGAAAGTGVALYDDAIATPAQPQAMYDAASAAAVADMPAYDLAGAGGPAAQAAQQVAGYDLASPGSAGNGAPFYDEANAVYYDATGAVVKPPPQQQGGKLGRKPSVYLGFGGNDEGTDKANVDV